MFGFLHSLGTYRTLRGLSAVSLGVTYLLYFDYDFLNE
jgi:hypothetical protein